MAASKIQANWAAVALGSQAIVRVDSVTFSQGGTLQGYSGDTDHYDTVKAHLMSNPTASVTTSDPGTLMGIAPGTVGSFSATHKDALLSTGGDILYVLANAVSENVQTSGAHAAFGTATLSMQSFSSDGSTNPLSFTRA